MTINIYYNGECISLLKDTSLQDILDKKTNQNIIFAVAVNGQVVPCRHYNDLTLSDGDTVDVVSPIAGG